MCKLASRKMPPKAASKNQAAEVLTGKFLFKNGSKYEGEYIVVGDTPYRHGTGTYHEALTVQDKFDCPGFDPLEVDAELAQIFRGQWANDVFVEGSIEYPQGGRFEGKIDYNGDYLEGKYFFKNGDVWDGPWKNCKMDGEGVFTDRDGVQWKGIMKENVAESMIQIRALE